MSVDTSTNESKLGKSSIFSCLYILYYFARNKKKDNVQRGHPRRVMVKAKWTAKS